MMTAIGTPEEEPVDYDALVAHYIDQHQHLMRSAYSVMTRAIRLGGRK